MTSETLHDMIGLLRIAYSLIAVGVTVVSFLRFKTTPAGLLLGGAAGVGVAVKLLDQLVRFALHEQMSTDLALLLTNVTLGINGILGIVGIVGILQIPMSLERLQTHRAASTTGSRG